MKDVIRIVDPKEIEKLSFEIIEKEAGPHNFNPYQWRIVRRIIHTTADFDLIRCIKFHPSAISSGIDAIKNGCSIFTDTKMVEAGINKKNLKEFGCKVLCYIDHPEVVKIAKEKKSTRASTAVDYVAPFLNNSIYVVGNAPTALIRLYELIRSKSITPALVIATAVGFVNAKESKDLFIESKIVPFISVQGRKGGSAIGASIINELVKLAIES